MWIGTGPEGPGDPSDFQCWEGQRSRGAASCFLNHPSKTLGLLLRNLIEASHRLFWKKKKKFCQLPAGKVLLSIPWKLSWSYLLSPESPQPGWLCLHISGCSFLTPRLRISPGGLCFCGVAELSRANGGLSDVEPLLG